MNTKNIGIQGLQLTDGNLIQTEFSASGGITYVREHLSEEARGRGQASEFKTQKLVDDVELVRESRAIVSRAYNVMAKHCAHTPIGWFADDAAIGRLEPDFVEVRQMAQVFNETAKEVGSARRVTAEIYALRVSVDDKQVARRLARLVTERLSGLKDALLRGDLKEAKESVERCRHLDRLAVGIQAEAVRVAVDHGREERKRLAKAEREGYAARADVEAIDAAIGQFTFGEQ